MQQRLIGLIIFFIWGQIVVAQSLRTLTPPLWKGEPFGSQEGGLLFNLIADNRLRAAEIIRYRIKFYNPAKAQHLVIDYRARRRRSDPVPIWKVPTGDYKLTEIEFYDRRNRQRFTWLSKDKKDYPIKAGQLANYGRWFAVLLPNRSIRMVFKDSMNPPRPPQPQAQAPQPSSAPQRTPSSTAPLLPSQRAIPPTPPSKPPSDATTPSQPKTSDRQITSPQSPGLPPVKRNLGTSRQDSSRPLRAPGAGLKKEEHRRDLRAVFRYDRKISMVYSINLFRDNRYARNVMSVIDRSDANIRQCYVDALEANDQLQGKVSYKFIISGKTKTMRSLKLISSGLNDNRMVECIYWKIAALDFPVPKSMLGEITFEFKTFR